MSVFRVITSKFFLSTVFVEVQRKDSSTSVFWPSLVSGKYSQNIFAKCYCEKDRKTTDVRDTYFKVRGQLTDQQICRQTAGHKGMKKSLVHGQTDREASRQAGRRSKKTVTQTTT